MEEYLSMDIYVSKRNNSLINGKMIGRVLGVLLFIEAGNVCTLLRHIRGLW